MPLSICLPVRAVAKGVESESGSQPTLAQPLNTLCLGEGELVGDADRLGWGPTPELVTSSPEGPAEHGQAEAPLVLAQGMRSASVNSAPLLRGSLVTG